jgi:hypothetical protein
MALTKIGKEGISNISNSSDATAITIDSSENVLVAKTATNYQTVGVEAKSTGQLWATADGNNPILAARKSSDGKIQTFYKDTTEVGNIGAVDGDLYLGTGSKGIRFIDANSAIIPADPSSSGATNTNAIDLGASFGTFKDLYLSGGAFIGGTGSANKLADYEEGTFSCTTSQSGYAIQAQHGRYTKIGQLVHINFKVNFNAVDTINSTVTIAGLPFTVSSIQSSGVVRESSNTGAIYVVNVSPSGTQFSMNSMDNVSNGSTRTIATNENYIGSFIYHV